MTEPSKVLGVSSRGERGRYLHHARRAFLDALQTFFSQDDLWGEPNLYKWVPNNVDTSIVIASEYTEEQEIPTPRHMILVNRGPVSFPKTSIANFNAGPASPIRKSPLQPGQQYFGKKYSALGYADMQIQCFSQLTDQCEEIAWGAATALMTFALVIKEKGNLHRLDNPQVGPATPIARSDSKIMMSVVPITVPVVFPFVWTTTHASVVSGGIDMDIEEVDR